MTAANYRGQPGLFWDFPTLRPSWICKWALISTSKVNHRYRHTDGPSEFSLFIRVSSYKEKISGIKVDLISTPLITTIKINSNKSEYADLEWSYFLLFFTFFPSLRKNHSRWWRGGIDYQTMIRHSSSSSPCHIFRWNSWKHNVREWKRNGFFFFIQLIPSMLFCFLFFLGLIHPPARSHHSTSESNGGRDCHISLSIENITKIKKCGFKDLYFTFLRSVRKENKYPKEWKMDDDRLYYRKDDKLAKTFPIRNGDPPCRI